MPIIKKWKCGDYKMNNGNQLTQIHLPKKKKNLKKNLIIPKKKKQRKQAPKNQ